jgi:predicted GNAT family N-acyltransferase
MTKLEISEAFTFEDHAFCVQIRTLVFVVGQSVPPELEIDQHENTAHHFLARLDGVPVAAARWRSSGSETAKIERMAVLPAAQGLKIGTALLEHMIEVLTMNNGIDIVKLGAQDYAIPFYEKQGFTVQGDGFLDAGIAHHMMQRSVRKYPDELREELPLVMRPSVESP